MSDIFPMGIRIGTLASGGEKTAEYLRQILPHGFESIGLTFWQTLGNTDLRKLAREAREVCEAHGAAISSLGIFGNPLEEDAKDKETRKGWERLIDNAHLFGCDVICGFAGRLRGKPINESMKKFKKVFGPLTKRAADKGVRLAFENCDMGGRYEAGDWNIAQTPMDWEMMFHEVPAENLGLEWEPCHQMVKLIDPIAQLRKWVKKVFHVHGKDATVAWDVVREYGVYGHKPFAWHRTPGFGDSNWTDIVTILRMNGYAGSIDIEGWHDPVYRADLEMTGQVHALNYLKRCRGGDHVQNPA
jgi:sugar phosphate isomerase/epimerase